MAHYYRPSAPQRSASSAALFQPVAGVPSHDGWSGSLLKRGAGNAAFKLRFFVLPRDTNRLLWYEDERGWQSSPPHRAVQIVGVGEAISASGEHRFCFDVWAKELDAGSKARGGVLTRMLRRKGSTTDGSLYRLAAGSYAEASGWLRALRSCLPAPEAAEPLIEDSEEAAVIPSPPPPPAAAHSKPHCC